MVMTTIDKSGLSDMGCNPSISEITVLEQMTDMG
jgi:hypothetical protein